MKFLDPPNYLQKKVGVIGSKYIVVMNVLKGILLDVIGQCKVPEE